MVPSTKRMLNKSSFRTWMHEGGDKNQPSRQKRARLDSFGFSFRRHVYTMSMYTHVLSYFLSL